MTDEANPLEEARDPTELEVLKERARKMGIGFSNNIGVESLRQKIAEKQEGKAQPENLNPALPVAQAAEKPSLLSFGSTLGAQTPAMQKPVAEEAQGETTVAPASSDTKDQMIEMLKAQLAAVNAVKLPVDALPVAPVNALTGTIVPTKMRTLQQIMRDEQTKLIRIRIQNLDPKKKDLHGEIITVANEYLGTIKKFVPYGEATDEGYHVPYCIYEFMKTKRFLNIRTTRDRVTKQIKVEQNMSLEYSLEILPQLTQEELNRLAASQAAAGSLN